MAFNAEQLNIIIAARTQTLQKELDGAERRIARFERQTRNSMSATQRSFALLEGAAGKLGLSLSAGALAGGMVASLKNAIDTAVEIDNLARVAGVGTTEFQKFAIAAQKVGIDQSKLADILKDVNDKFGDYMATGAGPLADFFDNIAPKVGVAKDAFIGLSSDQALGLYVKTLQEAGVNQQEMTFYMEALASDATALNPLLKDNAAALTSIGDSAERTGRLLDEGMIKNAKIMQDRWTQVLGVMTTHWNNFWLTVGMGIDELMNISTEAQLNDATATIESQYVELNAAREKLARLNENAPAMLADPTLAPGYKARLQEAQDQYNEIEAAVAATSERINQLRTDLETDSMLLPPIVTTDTNTGSGTGTTPGAGKAAKDKDQAKKAWDGLMASIDATTKAEIDFSKAQQVVNDALNSGIITQQEADFALGVLTDRMKIAKGEMLDLSSVAGILEGGLTDAFMSIIDGTQSTKDAFKSMARAVIAELYRVLVVQRLVGSIGTASKAGSGILGFIGNAFPALKAGASGGYVQAGNPMVVGEHGRELFVPPVNGRILNAAQAQNMSRGSSGGVTIVQNINISTGVQQTVRNEIRSLMPQIADSAKAAVLDAKRRGGSYGSAFA